MRIYYFGELIEDTENPKQKLIEQTRLDLEKTESEKTIIDSLGDLLKDIDLSLDIYKPITLA